MNEISETDFNSLRAAKDLISNGLSIERNYDIAMENYVELEETVFSLGLEKMVFDGYGHNEFQQIRETVSRRLLNFLSSFRFYSSTVSKHAKKVLLESDFQLLEQAHKDGPHQPMEFRMTVALRNFSQHTDLPLSSLSVNRSWELKDEDGSKDRHYTIVIPWFDALQVAKDFKLSKDVTAALKALGDKVDPMPIVRKSIEHLGKLNQQFRDLSKIRTEDAITKLRFWLNAYNAVSEEGKALVVIAEKVENDRIVEAVQIFDEFFEFREWIMRKNRSHPNLSRGYVAWQEPPKKPAKN